MFMTNDNLKGLRCESPENRLGRSRSSTEPRVAVLSKPGREHLSLHLRAFATGSPGPTSLLVSTGSEAVMRARLTLRASPRGVHDLDHFEFASSYPLGFFRSWTLSGTECKIYCYPSPRGAPLSASRSGSGVDDAGSSEGSGSGDFRGFRDFRRW